MNFNSIKKVLFIVVIALAAFGAWQGRAQQEDYTVIEEKGDNLRYRNIRLKEDLNIRAEVAASAYSREKGLSGRRSLPLSEGMLFVFNEPEYYSMWMKDMHFPIDIVWIDKQYQIVGIAKNVDPSTYPQQFKPALPSSYVLEINAGLADEYELAPGDSVFFEL
jgi:uncharacterized membrane protein (UPF0127 family)